MFSSIILCRVVGVFPFPPFPLLVPSSLDETRRMGAAEVEGSEVWGGGMSRVEEEPEAIAEEIELELKLLRLLIEEVMMIVFSSSSSSSSSLLSGSTRTRFVLEVGPILLTLRAAGRVEIPAARSLLHLAQVQTSRQRGQRNEPFATKGGCLGPVKLRKEDERAGISKV